MRIIWKSDKQGKSEVQLEDIKINKQPMVKWGATANHQVLVAKWGPASPMEVVEEHILNIIFHVKIIKDPLMPKKIIKLANSLIWGSVYEKNVKDWKNLPKNKAIGEVGQKWWQNFYKRNKEALSAKCTVRFDNKQDDQHTTAFTYICWTKGLQLSYPSLCFLKKRDSKC